MKKWLKLVNYEVNYFRNSFLSVIGVSLFLYVVGVFIQCQSYLREAKKLAEREFYSESTALEMLLNTYDGGWFTLSFGIWSLISLILVIAYMLYLTYWTWNREWSGNKTIYRTLQLPVPKWYVYLSKVCTLLIYLGAFYVYSTFLPIITRFIAERLLLDIDSVIYKGYPPLAMTFVSIRIKDWIWVVFVMVSLVFLLFFFTKCYGWKGRIGGILLFTVGGGMTIYPLVNGGYDYLTNYFFTWEIGWLYFSIATIFILLGNGISLYLFYKRVEV